MSRGNKVGLSECVSSNNYAILSQSTFLCRLAHLLFLLGGQRKLFFGVFLRLILLHSDLNMPMENKYRLLGLL